MKNIFILIMISFFAFFPCFASDQVRITGGVCVNGAEFSDIKTLYSELSTEENNQYWGIGWEVIFHKLGIGGNYYIDFNQDESREWTMSWYSEVFFISYHFLGANFFVDPFFQAGLGSAGGVYLGKMNHDVYDDNDGRVAVSLFPFVGTGLLFHFHRFLIGAKVNYTPEISPLPVTSIPGFHLNHTQLLVFTGVSF